MVGSIWAQSGGPACARPGLCFVIWTPLVLLLLAAGYSSFSPFPPPSSSTPLLLLASSWSLEPPAFSPPFRTRISHSSVPSPHPPPTPIPTVAGPFTPSPPPHFLLCASPQRHDKVHALMRPWVLEALSQTSKVPGRASVVYRQGTQANASFVPLVYRTQSIVHMHLRFWAQSGVVMYIWNLRIVYSVYCNPRIDLKREL